MNKRVFEYAKDKNIPNKKIIEILNEIGFDSIKTHFSSLTDQMVEKLDNYFKENKAASASKQDAKTAAKPEDKKAVKPGDKKAKVEEKKNEYKPQINIIKAKPQEPAAPQVNVIKPAEPASQQPAAEKTIQPVKPQTNQVNIIKPAVQPVQQQPATPNVQKTPQPAPNTISQQPQQNIKPEDKTKPQDEIKKTVPQQPLNQNAPRPQQPVSTGQQTNIRPQQPNFQHPAQGQQRPQNQGYQGGGQSQNFNRPQQRPGGQQGGFQKPQGGGFQKNKPGFTPPPVVDKPVPRKIEEKKIEEKKFEKKGTGKFVDDFDELELKKKEEKIKQKKRNQELMMQEENKKLNEPSVDEAGVVTLSGPLSVKEMCDLFKLNRIDVIKKLMNYNIMNVNQKIPVEIVQKIAEDCKITVNVMLPIHEEAHEEPDDKTKMIARPPIVTIMGHVDHGKTSLLDAVRKTNVVATEDGGITQHIGAYQVDIVNAAGIKQKITFLDTPGHEAFTQMRAQGSKVTDIAILVVSADDGVQPQTIEAIDHAIAAEIPIIVAINKIDKPGANVENVKKQLTEHGLVPEDWGGDTVCVEVSAKQRINIDGLLEMILLVAEMRDLKADPTRKAVGVVIESKLDKGRGPVATILIQKGTLSMGDAVVVGCTYGKIRLLNDYRGSKIQKAGPSTPVEIIGLSDVPQAGDRLKMVSSEKVAREIAEHRQTMQRDERMKSKKHISLSDLFKEIQTGKVKDLNIILKGDVGGSLIALSDSLVKLSNEKVRINIIHSNVGAITENDVLLATASNAIIIGFRVRPSALAEKLAETEHVDIKVYRIIYDAIDQIQQAMIGMYDPTYKEVVLGRAEIRQTFKVPNVGIIAGCYVKDGKITRDASIRVIRGGVEIYEGGIKSLKRFKDDAKEVATNLECGIGIERYNDLKEGDILEAFEMQEVKAVIPPSGHETK